MVRSGTEEGGPKKGPPKAARVIRSGASRGAHVKALFECLHILETQLPELPSVLRVSLRDHRAALVRSYPEILRVNESELAQALAEEDGEEID